MVVWYFYDADFWEWESPVLWELLLRKAEGHQLLRHKHYNCTSWPHHCRISGKRLTCVRQRWAHSVYRDNICTRHLLPSLRHHYRKKERKKNAFLHVTMRQNFKVQKLRRKRFRFHSTKNEVFTTCWWMIAATVIQVSSFCSLTRQNFLGGTEWPDSLCLIWTSCFIAGRSDAKGCKKKKEHSSETHILIYCMVFVSFSWLFVLVDSRGRHQNR